MVLSSQRVEMKDALYNASRTKTARKSANPLVQDGQKLIPSVTRVFSKDQDMYVYLQAYEQGAERHSATGCICDVLSRANEGI